MENERETFVIELLTKHIFNGDIEALQDLVELLKQPGYQAQATIKKILFSGKITSEQKGIILSQSEIFEDKELEQLNSILAMINQAKRGDKDALLSLLKTISISGTSQEILTQIYLSKTATDEQKKIIQAQSIFSKKELSRRILTDYALKGDLDALNDLIFFIQSYKEKDRTWGAEILKQIFFSGESTAEQKRIIWSHKDIVVHTKEVDEYDKEEVFYGPDKGWATETKKVTRIYPVSFHEYIKPYLTDLSKSR